MPTNSIDSSGAQKIFQKVEKIMSKIESFLLILAGIGLLAMLVTISCGIISRSVFNHSILWTYDLAGYLLLFLAFSTAPWLLKHDGHVKVDLFVSMLQGRFLKINTIFISFISVVVCSIFFWFSLKVTLDLFQDGTVMMESVPWPKFALMAPIAIGTLFLLIRFLLIIWENLLVSEQGSPLYSEQDKAI